MLVFDDEAAFGAGMGSDEGQAAGGDVAQLRHRRRHDADRRGHDLRLSRAQSRFLVRGFVRSCGAPALRAGAAAVRGELDQLAGDPGALEQRPASASDRSPAARRASGRRGCRCARSRRGCSPPSLAIAPTICRGSTLCRLPTAMRYVAIGTSERGRRGACGPRAAAAGRPVAAAALLVVPAAAPSRACRRRPCGGGSGSGSISSGRSSCISTASAAAMSAAGTSCSCS